VLLDCVLYCAVYSILFRGAVFFRSRCNVAIFSVVLHLLTLWLLFGSLCLHR